MNRNKKPSAVAVVMGNFFLLDFPLIVSGYIRYVESRKVL